MNFSRHHLILALGAFAIFASFHPAAQAADPATLQLAKDGAALMPVVVGEKASEESKKAAAELADYLGRMAGAKFDLQTGDGSQGIVVGVTADFPQIQASHPELMPPDASTNAAAREDYVLHPHTKGLHILGATDRAVNHAVWDVLHRLGHRQFFPGQVWEVVPKTPELRLTVPAMVKEHPSYHSRRIWYGFGPWDYAEAPYADWCRKNHAVEGIDLNTGHAYDKVAKDAEKEFAAHPEYWPLLNGKREPVRNPKPCLGNPAVRALFVRHALKQLEKDPSLDSVSMDPSDGGGWCECELCAKLGSVTDQAVTVANEVAAAVQEKFPGRFVGMYAYNMHSPPPAIDVHPKVIISVATAFIRGGLELDAILSGWKAKKAALGIREYYSVNTWDRDMPGQARGGNLDYLKRTIPDFHAKGARFLSAESSDNWGPNGLGYYVASRLMWNVHAAGQVDALVEDFLSRAFGPAKEPMREFYTQLDSAKPHLVADDQLGRMFRSLEKALKLAGSDDVRARVNALTLYAHYCSLYQTYSTADGKARQPAFEALIRHAYRMRSSMLVHTKVLYRDLDNRDKTVAIPEGAAYNIPEGKNPWKSSKPFSTEELAAFLTEGIRNHPLVELAFQPVTFSSNLVPAAGRLGFPKDLPEGQAGTGRGVQTFYTHFDKTPATLELRITGGLIAHYRNRGNIKVELWKIGGASQTGELETRAGGDQSVPPDGVERTVKIPVAEPGLYKVMLSDGHDKTQVLWPAGQPMTVVSTQDTPMNDNYHLWMQYFYVPKGTTTIGFFGGKHGEIRDSLDRPHFWLNGREPNFYSVAVPPGQDGKLWHLKYGSGSVRLLTVPPCFATRPEGLLLPAEVVERDGVKQ